MTVPALLITGAATGAVVDRGRAPGDPIGSAATVGMSIVLVTGLGLPLGDAFGRPGRAAALALGAAATAAWSRRDERRRAAERDGDRADGSWYDALT